MNKKLDKALNKFERYHDKFLDMNIDCNYWSTIYDKNKKGCVFDLVSVNEWRKVDEGLRVRLTIHELSQEIVESIDRKLNNFDNEKAKKICVIIAYRDNWSWLEWPSLKQRIIKKNLISCGFFVESKKYLSMKEFQTL